MMATKRKKKGGVYVWRTRKPGSLLGLPASACAAGAVVACVGLHTFTAAPWFLGLVLILFSGTHFAYVGETVSFYHRSRQHLGNVGTTDTYQSSGQPWADLRPKMVLRIPLPTSARYGWTKRLQKIVLRSVETFFILLFWPVYNDAKNRWNPRRIPKNVAKRQRLARDGRRVRWSLNFRAHHALGLVIGGILLVVFVIY